MKPSRAPSSDRAPHRILRRKGAIWTAAAAAAGLVLTTSAMAGAATPAAGTPASPAPAAGVVGWASANGGTTGGAGGTTVTVTSVSALSAAVAGDSPKTVQVSGKYTCSSDVRVGSNTTVVGLSGSSLTGCGLNMRDVHNVIVRNMTISKVPASNGNGDAIHVDHSTNLWIDHDDLSSDTTHGTDYYDGLVDITHAADYITVSWSHIHNHIKCSLVGHSDSNASEDTGHLRVTYHHNWFDTCAERNPRVRFGNPVHVFNNYYVNNGYTGYSYGIASTDNAGILVEGNYFENIADPFHEGEGSSPPGNLVARDNYFVNSGTGVTRGTVASIPYAYTLDSASTVKGIVTSGAGPKY